MKKKKKRYYRKQDNELRQSISIILGFLTPVIIFFVLWGLLACIIILIIIGIFYLTHRLIKGKGRYNTKIGAVILSYLIACGIIAGGLCYGYHKIGAISHKIDEMTEGFSKVISIGQGKKGNIELQPNELGIMQEVLNNMTTTTGQVQ